MKYTFVNDSGKQETVTIDDAWISKQKKACGITTREAILMWLSDEGYITDPTIVELTQKAKENGTGAQASTGKRKAPKRKPDEVKRAIIDYVAAMLEETDKAVISRIHNVEVTNPERIIAFEIGTDKYELTLSKKRKPKN